MPKIWVKLLVIIEVKIWVVNSAKNFSIKWTTDALKTVSKRVIQTVEATGDLVGEKITNKNTKVSKT